MILQQSYNYIKENYPHFTKLTIKDFRAGTYMLAVELSDGSMGIASSEPDGGIHCDKKDRDFGEFTPLQTCGRTIESLFIVQKHSVLIHTLKVACINAIAAKINELQNYKIISDKDPIDYLDLAKFKTITMVGAFHSYIKKIIPYNAKLNVLELNESAMLPEHRKYYVPANQFSKILPISDLILITGLTLVNNTFDALLQSCNPEAKIIVVGPSGNMIPSVLFEQNVDIIGGTRITNKNVVFDLISQGAAGYHLFKYCAEKICVLNERK